MLQFHGIFSQKVANNSSRDDTVQCGNDGSFEFFVKLKTLVGKGKLLWHFIHETLMKLLRKLYIYVPRLISISLENEQSN